MGVAKKQNSSIHFETFVGVVNNTFARCKANFIKILPAVNACCLAIIFYLEHIKAL